MKGYFFKQSSRMHIFPSFEEAKEWFLEDCTYDDYFYTSILVADVVAVDFSSEHCKTKYALLVFGDDIEGCFVYGDDYHTINEKIEARFNRANGKYEISVYELHNIEEYVAEINVEIKRN